MLPDYRAYSNLIELLLPNYVRLSIHAHNNSGPKFAVRLLPKDVVRPIRSLEDRHEPIPAFEFQIPTPWHNSILKLDGDDMLYLARAEVAKTAIQGPGYNGAWVDGPNGPYFNLQRTNSFVPESTVTISDEKKRPEMACLTLKDVEAQRDKTTSKRTVRLIISLRPFFVFTSMFKRFWNYVFSRT
jgi:hypothetical protein